MNNNETQTKKRMPRTSAGKEILSSEQVEELSESVLDDLAGGAVTGPMKTMFCTGD